MKKTSAHKIEKVVAVSAGIAAATIAATLLLGKNGKKNRKSLKDWSERMKEEVVDKAKDLKVVSGPIYEKIVDQVAKKYGNVQEISKNELVKEISLLKKEWVKMTKGAKPKSKPKSKKTK